MQIDLRPLASIRQYENNPRVNDAGVEAVARSIQEFGFRQPIVVDEDGVIIVGHTRYKAALKLRMEQVPVHVAVGLSPEQIRAYRIADNQTATLSHWDNDKLPFELMDLQGTGFDFNFTGFGADELMRLLQTEPNGGLTDPDAVPEPPDEATTQPGDLWLLGDHRLLCGDSSKPEDVDRLLDGADIHLVNTDPPYNVKVEPRSNNAIAAGLQSFSGHAPPEVGCQPPSGQSSRHDQEAARQGPAAGQRLRLRRGIRPPPARLVRQPVPRAAARPRVLHLGRIRQFRQLPAGAEGRRPVLLPVDHLGQAAPRPDQKGLHGRP